jgi:hypothetical protein
MYFYELDAREKITSRLQLPLAILLAAISFFGVVIKGLNAITLVNDNTTFIVFLAFSFIVIVVAAGFFVRALWGHTYEFIPTPVETEKYKEQLIATYKEFDDCDNLVEKYLKEYLYRYYSECATKNTHVNDIRSEALHKCISCLVLAAIPLLTTYVLFNFYNLNEKSQKTPTEIVITQPISVKLHEQMKPTGKENDREATAIPSATTSN